MEKLGPKAVISFFRKCSPISFSFVVIFPWGTYYFSNDRFSSSGEITPALNSKREPVIQGEEKYTQYLTSGTL